MSIRYIDTIDGMTPDQLRGFFEDWRSPPDPRRHLRMLRNSRHVVLALDPQAGRAVGFINALADGEHFAFIPLLEVLPAWRGRGIGSELLRRMLERLRDYPCIDLTCDTDLQPFYARLGMLPSRGMVIRNYDRRGPDDRPNATCAPEETE